MKLISLAVEASPVGTKPPAAVDERISKDGRHDSDAAAPLSTTISSLQGRAGGSAFTPKLVELVFGLGSTRRAEKPFPRIACSAVAAPSVHSRVFVFACPFAFMARHGCRAPCSRRVTCSSIFLISSEISSSFLFHRSKQLSIPSKKLPFFPAVYRIFPQRVDIHPPAWVHQTRTLLAGGRGICPQGQPRSPSVACQGNLSAEETSYTSVFVDLRHGQETFGRLNHNKHRLS